MGGRGHPEWGSFKLGKTNPNLSTSGLNATIAAYFAATGRSSDLTSADIANPKVVEFVRGVESGIVHYGDTTLTFLANLAEAGQRGRGLTYISAVTVEEKSVWDYNQGNPSGNPKTVGQQPAPKVPLVAIYPKDGTLVSDNPYIVLGAPWVDGAKQAAAADFLAYVRTPEQQERFAKAAFRSFEGKPGALTTRDNGMLPDAKLAVLDLPGPPRGRRKRARREGGHGRDGGPQPRGAPKPRPEPVLAPVQPPELPPHGSPARGWVERAERAVRMLDELVGSAEAGATAQRLGTVRDGATGTLRARRTLGGQVTVFDQALTRIDVDRLIAERTRLGPSSRARRPTSSASSASRR